VARGSSDFENSDFERSLQQEPRDAKCFKLSRIMWQLTISQRLRQLERRVLELSAWSNALETPVTNWQLTQPGQASRAVKLGEPWGFTDGQNGYNTHKQGAVRFTAGFELPSSMTGFPVELELDFDGEGFVEIRDENGGLVFRGGLNGFHKSFRVLERAAGGESFTVTVDAVPKGLFGSRNDAPILGRAMLIAPHAEIRGFVAELKTLHSTCVALADRITNDSEVHDAVPLLIAAAEGVLTKLLWTSNSADYTSRLLHGTLGGDWEKSILWSLPEMPALRPLEGEWLQGAHAAHDALRAHLETIRKLYPPQGAVALTGHAHIDLAWLWPIAETRRKIRRTFATVLGLMNRFPDFTFNQSSAQAYAWIEEDDPAMFAEVKARVIEGRWETVGGMWVEPDGNMPSGESWARQMLYGQGYFHEKFRRGSSVAWLPDTFGFNAQLPQLLQASGITGFFTTKLNWNETTKFPHDLFQWRGLDGTSVLAHSFENPRDNYNAVVGAKSGLETWRNFRGKSNSGWLEVGMAAPQTLLSFGYGDGGGGPTREMLEEYGRIASYPALPKLRMTRIDEFFERLPQSDLPVWDSEIYFELHRGTLTTQARTKKLHRDLETRLCEAESLEALGWLKDGNYSDRLEGLWKVLLLHEFHDILPGSSIREVYEDAERELSAALTEATTIRDASLKRVSLEVSLEKAATPRGEGKIFVLENEFLCATIDASGWVTSLRDLALNREVLSAPATLVASRDVPREWEAWDVNAPINEETIGGEVTLEVLEDGVRVVRKWRDSRIVQTYRLKGRRLEVACEVDWFEKRVLVRARVPLSVSSDHATYETAFGALSRPTHKNLADDAARFEVCAHRWADLSEHGYGLSLLNEGKYGHSATRDTLFLSLLRGTMYPDPAADLGHHQFGYALLPHVGDHADGNVALEATRFSSTLLTALQTQLRLSGVTLCLSTMKRAESGDAIILRLYEPYGARGTAQLKFPGIARAALTNLLEEYTADLESHDGNLALRVEPFKIITLKLWPR
jgi:alpha-mannosidase